MQHENNPTEGNEETNEKEEEHALWLEHAPVLYDVIITKSLIWPSLTVQFMPTILLVFVNYPNFIPFTFKFS